MAVSSEQALQAARAATRTPSRRLVEPYRGELHRTATGCSARSHDAEDALQDALLRAWRRPAALRGRSSLRSWLYTIATNTCLRRDRQAAASGCCRSTTRRAADPHDGLGEPLVESVWVEPYPDEHRPRGRLAGPERALRAARERRAGVHRRAPAPAARSQRAVLILREVLGFSAPGGRARRSTTSRRRRSTARCSAPARRSTSGCPSAASRRRCARSATSALREIVERLRGGAGSGGDVDAVVAMLAEDAAWSMPPLAELVSAASPTSTGLPRGARPLTPARWRWRHVAGDRQRAARRRPSYAGPRPRPATCPSRSTCSRFEGDQISDVTSFIARVIDRSRTASPMRAGRTSRSTRRACTQRSRASGCRADRVARRREGGQHAGRDPPEARPARVTQELASWARNPAAPLGPAWRTGARRPRIRCCAVR